MRLICFRCANGLVVFRSGPRPTYSGVILLCLNDESVFRTPVPPLTNIAVALRNMAAHAVALSGAIQQVFEIVL